MSKYQPKKDISYKNEKREIIYSSNKELGSPTFLVDLGHQMYFHLFCTCIGFESPNVNTKAFVGFSSPNSQPIK